MKPKLYVQGIHMMAYEWNTHSTEQYLEALSDTNKNENKHCNKVHITVVKIFIYLWWNIQLDYHQKILLLCRNMELELKNFIKENGLVLKSKSVTVSWLYMRAHKHIYEEYFDNLTKVDVKTFDEDTLIEVEVKAVDITWGSVWISNDEMIVQEILFDMGHSNDKTSKSRWTLKIYEKVD